MERTRRVHAEGGETVLIFRQLFLALLRSFKSADGKYRRGWMALRVHREPLWGASNGPKNVREIIFYRTPGLVPLLVSIRFFRRVFVRYESSTGTWLLKGRKGEGG